MAERDSVFVIGETLMAGKKEPYVSIIMSVYNTKEQYLRGAIESILQQTHSNYEFIIIDDASSKECKDVLSSYKDERIVIIHNEKNYGLTKSLNIGIKRAKGDYIARMDADDICDLRRLERQVQYMEEHTDIAVLACGTYVYTGQESKQFAGAYRQFEQERIRVRLSFANIEFTHPSVMFRGAFLKQYNLSYDEKVKKAQDYNMWVRCAEYGKLYCLQEPLFISRIHEEQIGERCPNEQCEGANITKRMCLSRLLPDYTEREATLYEHMRLVSMEGNGQENLKLIRKLIEANDKKRVYDTHIYKQELIFWWFRKCFYKENRHKSYDIWKTSYFIGQLICILPKQLEEYIQEKRYKKRIVKLWTSQIQNTVSKQLQRNYL